MRIHLYFLLFTVLSLGFASCEKEISLESGFTNDPTLPVGASGTSAFTFSAGGGTCSAAVLSGTYVAGTALTSANTVMLSVNVMTVGTYTVSTASANGISFSGSGTFTTTGPQNLVLTGVGTPTAAGSFNFTPAANACSFSITVTSTAPSPAVFSLAGSPGACTAFNVAGAYTAGTPVTATNTVTVTANVTTAGSYSISTNTVNGISFSANGVFTAPGSNSIVLQATGTPTAAGTNSFTTTASGSCTFSITTAPAAPPPGPAAYTLAGAPGNCSGAVVNGSYSATTPLNTSNTVSVQVNVTSVGAYTLTTNTVNGMTFSKSGTFATTGLQTITLQGSGTPTAAQTSVLTPLFAGSSCTFSITVSAAPPPSNGTFTCNIDGVFTSFNPYNYAQVTYNLGGSSETFLAISGATMPFGSVTDTYLLGISKTNGGAIPAGTYTQNTFINSGGVYKCSMDYYVDATQTHWAVADNTPFSTNPAFTITITNITATRYQGTFSGTLKQNFGQSPGLKVITNGVFDVPIIP